MHIIIAPFVVAGVIAKILNHKKIVETYSKTFVVEEKTELQTFIDIINHNINERSFGTYVEELYQETNSSI